MTIDMEVEDYFLRKLCETAINPVTIVPLLSKNLKGYGPDGLQTEIANGKYPAGIDQFTEVKVIQSGTVQYDMQDLIDDPQGSATVNKFQGKVRGTYIAKLKEKDKVHFGTEENVRGPLESLFRHVDFKPLMFGTFGECITSVKEVPKIAVEYGVEHLGRSMAATTVNAVRMTLRRRFATQLSCAV